MEILKVQQTDCGGRCGSDDFWVSKMHASAASSGARRAVAQRSRDRDKPAHFKWLVERIRERMEDLGQGTLPDGVFVHYASSHILLLSVTALEQVGEGLISSTLAATAGAPNCSGVLGSSAVSCDSAGDTRQVTLAVTKRRLAKTRGKKNPRAKLGPLGRNFSYQYCFQISTPHHHHEAIPRATRTLACLAALPLAVARALALCSLCMAMCAPRRPNTPHPGRGYSAAAPPRRRAVTRASLNRRRRRRRRSRAP